MRTIAARSSAPLRCGSVVFGLLLVLSPLVGVPAVASIVSPGEILVVGHQGFDAVDPATGAIRRVLETSDISWNLDIAVAGNGTLYLIGNDDLKPLDPVTAELTIVHGSLATNQPHQLHFDPDGKLLATGTVSQRWDGTTRTDPLTGATEVAFASSFDACGDGTPFEIPEGLPWFPPRAGSRPCFRSACRSRTISCWARAWTPTER
jgi:hypothetical protein